MFGARGMLGKEVVEALYDYGDSTIEGGNILDGVTSVEQEMAEAVINCAGVIPPKCRSVAQMIEVNAAGPYRLAETFRGPILHVSTDCVFDGEALHPYTVNDPPNNREPYGFSKGLGEVYAPHVMNVRTSFIGPEHGLMRWFLDQTEEVLGYKGAWWTGSTVKAVARELVQLVHTPFRPLVHLSTKAPINKYEVLCLLRDAVRARHGSGYLSGVEIIPALKPKINRALKPTVELPPLDECLDHLFP